MAGVGVEVPGSDLPDLLFTLGTTASKIDAVSISKRDTAAFFLMWIWDERVAAPVIPATAAAPTIPHAMAEALMFLFDFEK